MYLTNVPKKYIPIFVQNNNEISPLFLYERYRGGKNHGLICMQFLCALNIELEGDSDLSKDEMSEFYLNLTLIKSNHKTWLNFSKTSDLVMNNNRILQDKTYNFKRMSKKQSKMNYIFSK